MTTTNATTTDPRLERARARVYDRAEAVAQTLESVAAGIRLEAQRAHGRPTDDLLIPDDLVRGPDGQPIGCRGFAVLSTPLRG
ncbi:MAG TPA: hypothetical protein VNA32_03750 [Actinomycetota bacterium]|nr:hypothetical protein [Actinomycetota bacterium]